MNTLEEIKKMEDKTIAEELNKNKKNLFIGKFEVKNGHSKNIHTIKNLRKTIARMKTIQRQRAKLNSNKIEA